MQKKATRIIPIVLTFAGMLAIAPEVNAQRCEESITGSICEDVGNACSPPAGGTCRQVTTGDGVANGCACSAVSTSLFIVSTPPEPRSALPILVFTLGVALIVGIAVYLLTRARARR